MDKCIHDAWDLDEEWTLYCTRCDKTLSAIGKYAPSKVCKPL